MENKKLASFTEYMKKHPEQRFWQALRNWSEYDFIFGGLGTSSSPALVDTFYIED